MVSTIHGERSFTISWRSAELSDRPFWSSNVCWEFFKNPRWRNVATEGFGDLGYHCHVRQEQAVRFLP
eukprot:259945-Heterocapsa_arctica.AAC.1